MNPFLNLAADLVLSEHDVRGLIEGRAAIQKAIADLQAGEKPGETRDLSTLSDEDGDRFDGLVDRFDEVVSEIATRENEQRIEQRTSRAASIVAHKPSAVGTGAVGGAHTPRATEARDVLDPVEHPDPTKYSIIRCISLLARNKPVDGYEAEISEEIARRSGKSPQGFFVPFGLPMGRSNPHQHAERRDFDVAAGAGMIPTTHSNRFIDLMRNRMVLAGLGVQVMDDLVGNLDVAKKTGAHTAYWVGESTAPTKSSMAVGKVSYSPSTVGAYTIVTRRMMSQGGSESVNQRVNNDLLDTIAIELDRVGVNGSGTGAEPEGLLQNGALTLVPVGTNGGAVTNNIVIDLESTVAAANARLDNIAYLTSALGRGHLKKTEALSGSGIPILDDGQMNGYRCEASQQVPGDITKGTGTALTALIFGDWSKAAYALWTGFDLMVDPFSQSTTGDTVVTVLVDADFQVEDVTAFAACADIDPTV